MNTNSESFPRAIAQIGHCGYTKKFGSNNIDLKPIAERTIGETASPYSPIPHKYTSTGGIIYYWCWWAPMGYTCV